MLISIHKLYTNQNDKKSCYIRLTGNSTVYFWEEANCQI